MSMSVSGIGGLGNYSTQINDLIRDLRETHKIVDDIFQQAEDFQTQSEKEAVKDAIKKAEERIEEIRNKVKTMQPQLDMNLKQLETQIEALKVQMGMAV